MKKLALLTSVLALAACGGGSGSGGGVVPPVINSTEPVENVSFNGAFTVQTNDEGKIIALVETWGSPGMEETDTYQIDPETGKILDIQYSTEEETEVIDGAVQLYGRHVGLKFADFGMMYDKEYIPEWGTITSWNALLAGNPDKEIQTVNGTKSFAGTAVAVVGSDTYTIGEYGPTGGDSDVMITNTDNANLVFDGATGEYTLVMDFTKSGVDKWYKVTFNSTPTDKIATFSNPDNVDIDTKFKLSDDAKYVHNGEFLADDTHFYGDNSDISEATAEFSIYGLSGIDNNTVHFHSVFGGKVAE